MKNRFVGLLSAVVCLALSSVGYAQLALPGTNLGNTLESTWGYPAPTKALIDSMARAGFKTLRVPCAWSYNSTNGVINAAYMTQVTNVVNWAIADGMYVVLNDHWDTGWFSSADFTSYNPALNTQLINMWNQIAANFQNTSSTQLLFACTNEPNATTQAQTTVLYQYYQNWINAIRATGGNNATRHLVLQGPGCNIDNTCAWGMAMPSDPANKLMMEVHCYDPYQFTLMTSNQTWGNMFYFWGSGYHVTNRKLVGRNATWGEESWIQSEFAKMKTNFKDRGYPVLMGEWRAEPKPAERDLSGQYITQNYNSCTYWNKYFENACAQYGFYATCWDTPSQLFDWTTGAVKDQTQINSVLGTSCVAPIPGL
jgi:aryl-phospho-beta-D-glucosidase BglC (GH1 family)